MSNVTNIPEKFLQLFMIIASCAFFWGVSTWKFSLWGGVLTAFAILIFILFALGSEMKDKPGGRMLLRMASGQIVAAILCVLAIFITRSTGFTFASQTGNAEGAEALATTQTTTQAIADASTSISSTQMAMLSLLIPMVLFIALPAAWYALFGALPGFIAPKPKSKPQPQKPTPTHAKA